MIEPRPKYRRWPLIVFVCGLLAFAIGMAVLYTKSAGPNSVGQPQSLWGRFFHNDIGPRRPMPRSRHIKAYGIALRMYANDYETLPYSPDGTAAALYALKDYLETGDSAPQPPAFDDMRRLLTNCPFDYINTADFDLDSAPPLLVILAEQTPDSNGGRYCLPADGHPRYVQAGKTCDVGAQLEQSGP